jgi:pectinesterase
VVHYIGAGWTASGDFRDLRDWYGYLDTFAQRLEHPLAISWWRGGQRLPDAAR